MSFRTRAFSMSISEMALFSWRETHAVRESSFMLTYSGSKSWDALAFGPKMRIPCFRSWSSRPSKRVKSAVLTVGSSAPSEMSTILTEPRGSYA
jgi:hypothetical protein